MVRDAEKQEETGARAAGCVKRTRLSGPRREKAGFTLIELTVAIAILLVGALAAFATQVMSGQIIDSSEDVTVVISDLEACMEEMLLQPAGDMPGLYPEGVEVPGYDGLHVRNEGIIPNYLNWADGDPLPDILEIELAATWLDSRGRIQRQSLVTAKAR
jgi:prepilin-type N-terminal cleavage/methylation domain-containing protein